MNKYKHKYMNGETHLVQGFYLYKTSDLNTHTSSVLTFPDDGLICYCS